MFPSIGFMANAGPAGLALPGLHAWYDAADTSTIATSAGAVTQWRDKSGNGFHLGVSTGTNQPTATTHNGRNAVNFASSSSQWLENASAATAFRDRQVYTVALVWKHVGTVPGSGSKCMRWSVQTAARTDELGATDARDYTDVSATTDFRRNSAAAESKAYDVFDPYGLAPQVYVYNATTTQLRAFRGAAAPVENTFASTTTLSGTLDSMTLGAAVINGGKLFYANGVCCELAIWLADHWASRSAIYQPMKSKWAAL